MSGRQAQMSWAVLAGGCLAGAELARQGMWRGAPLAGMVTGGYVLWSVFWGLPPFWSWWRRHQEGFISHLGRLSHHQQAGFFAASLTAHAMALSVGIWLSLVGGGIFQFWRAWRAQSART